MRERHVIYSPENSASSKQICGNVRVKRQDKEIEFLILAVPVLEGKRL
jgi:hypothetical protein